MQRQQPQGAHRVSPVWAIADCRRGASTLLWGWRFMTLTEDNDNVPLVPLKSQHEEEGAKMKRGLMLAFMLSCGMWVVSQAQSSGSSGSSQTDGGSQTSGQTSGGYGQTGGDQSHNRIEGCLMGSSGNYTLMENKTGATYQLTGDTSKLSQHVGEAVQISGTKGSGSSGSSSGAASSGTGSSASGGTSTYGGTSSSGGMAAQQTFTVTSVKKISSNCTPSAK